VPVHDYPEEPDSEGEGQRLTTACYVRAYEDNISGSISFLMAKEKSDPSGDPRIPEATASVVPISVMLD
jgi:hypothetical protein